MEVMKVNVLTDSRVYIDNYAGPLPPMWEEGVEVIIHLSNDCDDATSLSDLHRGANCPGTRGLQHPLSDDIC